MTGQALAAVLVLSLVGWPPAGPPPDLHAAYPNPATPGDAGEFVVLDVPPDTRLSAYELTDGEDAIRLPPTNRTGRLAVAANATTARLVDHPVVTVPSFLALSNAGETVVLRRASDGTVVDRLRYGHAREATVVTDRGSDPLGATDHDPTTVRHARVTAFVLPDDPRPIESALATAERRVLLAGYTLTSTRIQRLLLNATRRGVSVRVLLDGSPVGGDSPAQVAALDRLAAAGVDVHLVGGPRARYAFHHAKYAVADDRAVVVTENWKASGTGGRGNRGWGVVVRNAAFADALATVFESDANWTGTRAWRAVRDPASQGPAPPANGSYPRRFEHVDARPTAVTLAVSPDNAETAVLEFVGGANESLRVQQVSLAAGRLRRAVVDAAERGVRVRLLLSSRWYVRDENRLLARCLNGYADRAGIPLTVRLVEPRSRYGKVHAKVAVADDERVLLGSLNWNEYALERNREVIVVAEGERITAYYGRVFDADWRGGAWRVPWSVLVAVLVAAIGTLGVLRRVVVFEGSADSAGGDVWRTEWDGAEKSAGFESGAWEERS